MHHVRAPHTCIFVTRIFVAPRTRIYVARAPRTRIFQTTVVPQSLGAPGQKILSGRGGNKSERNTLWFV